MIEDSSYPFHSFAFTLVEGRRPRAALRLSRAETGMYALHVERGSASTPTSQFTREVPVATAERVRDVLQGIGAYGWDEKYGDESAPGTRRWTMNVVFREGVFTLASRGGSDVPPGFERLLEELYRLDFPRSDTAADSGAKSVGGTGATVGSGIGGARAGGGHPFGSLAGMDMGSAIQSLGRMGGNIGGLSAGDLGAYNAIGGLEGALGRATGIDFSQVAKAFEQIGDAGEHGGFEAFGDMGKLMDDAQRDPESFQRGMRDEFRRLPPNEQNRLLDALASTGIAPRSWWEGFLRG